MATAVDPTATAGRHREVYTMRDIVIRVYKDTTNPGRAPGSWANADYLFKGIATGFTLTTKQEAELIHGQGTKFPLATRIGEVSYEWSIDVLYSNETYVSMGGYRIEQFIEGDIGYFAMQVEILNKSGTAATTRILTYCTITEIPFKVTEGECVSCSLSGVAEWVQSL